MTLKYPNVPAAFINALAEEGTKDEAVQFLQQQWNETCALREALGKIAMHNAQNGADALAMRRIASEMIYGRT